MKTFKNIVRQISYFLLLLFILLPQITYASFIESSMGTAIVNDATASYYNPAALILMKNSQIIPQGTLAYFRTRYSGESTSILSRVTESGSATSNTHFASPSLYVGIPINAKLFSGLAIVSNNANREVDGSSILRYVESNNKIQDFDVVPALGIKVNEMLSIGGGINFSYANFNLQPKIGFPGSNTSDSENHNQSDGTGVGGNVGFLLTPNVSTLIGFNYRSLTTYRLSGQSIFDGATQVISDNYHSKQWTPARSVLSISHFFTPKLGLIATVQRIQWSNITNIHIYGLATLVRNRPLIINTSVPFYLRNTWTFTLGGHYRITPDWIVRVASSYVQSPGNPHYQIVNGDSIILGATMGYNINKTITIDGGYAHAFMKDKNINIVGERFVIRGVNTGSRDAVSLKLTFNV